MDYHNSIVGFSPSYMVGDMTSESIKWHTRLGSISKDRMIRLAKEGFLGSLTKNELPPCESCVTDRLTFSLVGLPALADVRIRGVQPFRDRRQSEHQLFCMGMPNFLLYLEITSGGP